MLDIGTKVFGDWTVDEKIGSGAFGTVYRIKKEDFGNFYYAAMKVIRIPQDKADHDKLRTEGMDDESISLYYGQIAQDFIKEIKLLSSLDGITNIVDYKDHSIVLNEDFGYTIYIKMQLLTPLSKKLIDENKQVLFMSVDEVLDLGMDICTALETCEKHNIIHRDIKVDNIFVSSNGDYKLGDFGIARQLEATQGEMSKKGTLMYMAPEVFRGENYNKTADIYSLGIVLYRLLNKNRAPFFPEYPTPIKFTDKEDANAKRLKGEAFPDISGVSAELVAVLRKACAFNPEERYQTAGDFKRALKSIKKGAAQSVQPQAEEKASEPQVVEDEYEATGSAFNMEIPEVETKEAPAIEECFAEDTDLEATGSAFNMEIPAFETKAAPIVEPSFAEDTDLEATGSAFNMEIPAFETKAAPIVEPSFAEDTALDETVGVFNNIPFYAEQSEEAEQKTKKQKAGKKQKKQKAKKAGKADKLQEPMAEIGGVLNEAKEKGITKKLSQKTKVLMIINIILAVVSAVVALIFGAYYILAIIGIAISAGNLISLLVILFKYKIIPLIKRLFNIINSLFGAIKGIKK